MKLIPPATAMASIMHPHAKPNTRRNITSRKEQQLAAAAAVDSPGKPSPPSALPVSVTLLLLAGELAIFACCAFTHGVCPWWFEYELVDWTVEYILILCDCIKRLGGATDPEWESRMGMLFCDTGPAAPSLTYFHYQTRDSFDSVYGRDNRLVEQIRADYGKIKYHLVEAKFLKMTHDEHVQVAKSGGAGGPPHERARRSTSHLRPVDTSAQLAEYNRLKAAGELEDACTIAFYITHLRITLGGVKRLVRTSCELLALGLFPWRRTADTLVPMVEEHTAFLMMVWLAFPGLQSWDRVRFTNGAHNWRTSEL